MTLKQQQNIPKNIYIYAHFSGYPNVLTNICMYFDGQKTTYKCYVWVMKSLECVSMLLYLAIWGPVSHIFNKLASLKSVFLELLKAEVVRSHGCANFLRMCAHFLLLKGPKKLLTNNKFKRRKKTKKITKITQSLQPKIRFCY